MRHATSHTGETLTKQVTVRIIVPGHKPVKHRIHVARGQWFTGEHIQRLLEREGEMLERELAGYDFRLVELRGNQFNLIGSERVGNPAAGMSA